MILIITANENQVSGTEFSIERMRVEENSSSDFTYEDLTYGDDNSFTDIANAIARSSHAAVYTSMVDESSLAVDDFRTANPQEIFTYAKEQDIPRNIHSIIF